MDKILKFKEFSTAELADGMKNMNYISLKPVVGEKFAGIARVMQLKKGYSSLVTEAIKNSKKDEVLVIETNETKTAVWGDKKSTLAKEIGLSGVIINGNIRDLEGCEEIGIPIACRDVVSFGSINEDFGEIGGEISIDEIKIKDGDYISCDSSGVVVISPEEIDEVLKLSEEKKIADEVYKNSFK